jgi:hypothetical protein
MQTEATQQRDPESIILEALASAPVPPTDLQRRLKLNKKQLQAVLDGLVAARRIHGKPKLSAKGKPTKTMETYVLGAPPPPPPPPVHPRERAPREILRALEAKSLPPKQLKERVASTVTGLAKKDYDAVLAELIATGQVHARYKRKQDGTFGKTVEAYGFGPLTAQDFIEPILALCEKMGSEAKRLGVAEASFTASLLEGLSKSGIQIQAPRRTEPSSDDRAQVLRGVRELVAREGSGALIPIRKLRSTVELDKGLLDAALLQLFADDAIILHHHDYVGSLTEAERGELLLDRHGNYYIGVALKGEG